MNSATNVKAPEWQMDFEEYLDHLKLTERRLRDRFQLPVVGGVKKVLPLKDLREVRSILPLSHEFLREMLIKVKTQDNQLPFAEATFCIRHVDPRELKLGQRFVYRENYVALLEELPQLFVNTFAVASSITAMGAFSVFGRGPDSEPAMAFYLPPIVEKHRLESGEELVIMDGMHRNFLTRQFGATIAAIVAKNVTIPFPCACKEWSAVTAISLADKPADINERYFGLRKNLFRDLKYLGIDG